ncbi:hypothetical protein H6G81_04440 [Scytonema hofmannii FACHB-248]|uniref:DUF928 domain-containing protein n=1 Tax=Scytonema hofmannii FACHB-248 TaxID=1842502 RepID=A0ABR8GKD7_9CYAN|nr:MULTISPECIES: hypothetical protein [Nostocales]MBD2603798.1 hypothetical protein [Scytonema hofmannii FACHB-248]
MFNQSFFSLALIPVISFGGVSSEIATPFRQNRQIAQQVTTRAALFWQTRPRKRNISRSLTSQVCAIAPGLLETYQVWSDRPLFLWHSQGKNKDLQLTLRDFDTQEEVWTQKVNIADQKVSYSGKEPLKPGKRYQWQLSGSQAWATFQIMPADQRNQIQLDLQALEQKLKANKASQEEIALKKADYFLNYEIKHKNEPGIFHPWSDALQALYIENASPSFVEKREAYIANLCTDPTATKQK